MRIKGRKGVKVMSDEKRGSKWIESRCGWLAVKVASNTLTSTEAVRAGKLFADIIILVQELESRAEKAEAKLEIVILARDRYAEEMRKAGKERDRLQVDCEQMAMLQGMYEKKHILQCELHDKLEKERDVAIDDGQVIAKTNYILTKERDDALASVAVLAEAAMPLRRPFKIWRGDLDAKPEDYVSIAQVPSDEFDLIKKALDNLPQATKDHRAKVEALKSLVKATFPNIHLTGDTPAKEIEELAEFARHQYKLFEALVIKTKDFYAISLYSASDPNIGRAYTEAYAETRAELKDAIEKVEDIRNKKGE
jgi:hypothetical protein